VYTRIGIFGVNEILDFVGPVIRKSGISKKGNPFTYSYPSYRKEYMGKSIKMGSQRYVLFKLKGVDCIECGLKGKFFALESNYPDKDVWHMNLYGYDKDGNEVMMTKDHIIAKSKKGKNNLDNYQPMCYNCNQEKSNK